MRSRNCHSPVQWSSTRWNIKSLLDFLKMDWVYVTSQFLQDGNEVMIMPAITRVRPRSKAKRLVHFSCDVAYYILRYYFIR